MKKIILFLFFISSSVLLPAQQYSASVRLGTGLSMSEPSAVPFTVEGIGHFNYNSHWAFGAGTGYGLYDDISTIPLFANIKYILNPVFEFVFFADCLAGYGFALTDDNNGGFYLNPALGIEKRLWKKRFTLSAGYQLQKLERLKSSSNGYVSSQFAESLSFSSISLKLGIIF